MRGRVSRAGSRWAPSRMCTGPSIGNSGDRPRLRERARAIRGPLPVFDPSDRSRACARRIGRGSGRVPPRPGCRGRVTPSHAIHGRHRHPSDPGPAARPAHRALRLHRWTPSTAHRARTPRGRPPVQEVTCQEDVIRSVWRSRHRNPVLRAGTIEEPERVVEVVHQALHIHRRQVTDMPGLQLGQEAGCVHVDPALEDSACGVRTDGVDRARDARANRRDGANEDGQQRQGRRRQPSSAERDHLEVGAMVDDVQFTGPDEQSEGPGRFAEADAYRAPPDLGTERRQSIGKVERLEPDGRHRATGTRGGRRGDASGLVMGRLCSTWSPSPTNAHSTSCGPSKISPRRRIIAATRSASDARSAGTPAPSPPPPRRP